MGGRAGGSEGGREWEGEGERKEGGRDREGGNIRGGGGGGGGGGGDTREGDGFPNVGTAFYALYTTPLSRLPPCTPHQPRYHSQEHER